MLFSMITALILKKITTAFNDCNVYSLGCLAKPCRCVLMMLYLKTKTKTVHGGIDQVKLMVVFRLDPWFKLYPSSSDKKIKIKRERNHLNVKAIVQSLEEETRPENANNDDWQNQNQNKRNFIEPPTKKSCTETTSLEFLGWNCTGISVHSFLIRCGDGAVTESDRALHSSVRRPFL